MGDHFNPMTSHAHAIATAYFLMQQLPPMTQVTFPPRRQCNKFDHSKIPSLRNAEFT
jgi:hypothetical protein